MSLTANLGDVKTTVCHPASTTHGRLSEQQKQLSGITEGLIRIAVELDNLEDLKRDCERGFAAIFGIVAKRPLDFRLVKKKHGGGCIFWASFVSGYFFNKRCRNSLPVIG